MKKNTLQSSSQGKNQIITGVIFLLLSPIIPFVAYFIGTSSCIKTEFGSCKLGDDLFISTISYASSFIFFLLGIILIIYGIYYWKKSK